ncbi:reprolysin-like metallopeptidase [Vibrio atypicus]|uniref:reprolysin-like metallopeptidase n=1 Tax=Vibrio atypicus TaxID=558271 RepID=UPI00135B1C3D|nr:zinc-dependent metalloprotease family protein [Vibrio atypicus]
MKYSTLVGAISLSFLVSSNAVASELWQSVYSERTQNSKSSATFAVDADKLESHFTNTQARGGLTLQVPLPEGELVDFVLAYDSILSPEMQAKYPELRTYTGHAVGDTSVQGRFDYTPKGFHGMFSHNGKYVYVEPKPDGSGHYVSYNHTLSSPFQDQVLKYLQTNQVETEQNRVAARANIESRTYRLIVSATGEYSQYHGGTEALTRAAITTAINRVNQVYNSDLAVELQLVNFNIYTNASTDPFTDFDASEDIGLNHDDLTSKFGSDAFDVGHIFTTGGGGLAALGAVCDDFRKGAGVTGRSDPETDAFYIDYVAHELGHQFGANHTFNGNRDNCQGGNRNDLTAFEPGSGSTIMAYAGICGSDDLQVNSDAYFHAASIKEINDYLATQNCETVEVSATEVPAVDAGSDHTVPVSTPLVLTGSATGTGSLTYVWEQMDSGTGSSNLTTDLGNGPLFRSWTPTAEPKRYLPRLEDVIDGTLAKGETYATTSRDLNFRLTVRDGNGGVSSDDLLITVDANSGPFSVISPTTNATIVGNANVEWDEAGTAQAPVSCSTVDILLSTDGGVTFSQTLLSATNNDGSESVDFPAQAHNNARLMIQCSNNIFFAVSKGFSIALPEEVKAVDDAYTIIQDSAQTSFDVLANDRGEGTLKITAISYSGAGTASYTDTEVSYQPQASFVGTETITYTIVDSANQTATGTLTIAVNSNIATIAAVNDRYDLDHNSSATVLDVLANDAGQGSLTISAINYSGSGVLTNSGTGVNYQPSQGFSGVDSFTYTITDEASQTATTTVTINVAAESTGSGSAPSSSGGGGGSLNWFSLLVLAVFWGRRNND